MSINNNNININTDNINKHPPSTFLGSKTQPSASIKESINEIEKEDQATTQSPSPFDQCHCCNTKEQPKYTCKQCRRAFCLKCINDIDKEGNTAKRLFNSLDERCNWICFACVKECPCKPCAISEKDRDKEKTAAMKTERRCILCNAIGNLIKVDDLLVKIKMTPERRMELIEGNKTIGVLLQNSNKEICKNCFNYNQTVNNFFNLELKDVASEGYSNANANLNANNSNKGEDNGINQFQQLSKDLQKKGGQVPNQGKGQGQSPQGQSIGNKMIMGNNQEAKGETIPLIQLQQIQQSQPQPQMQYGMNTTAIPDLNPQNSIQDNMLLRQYYLLQNQQQQQQQQTQPMQMPPIIPNPSFPIDQMNNFPSSIFNFNLPNEAQSSMPLGLPLPLSIPMPIPSLQGNYPNKSDKGSNNINASSISFNTINPNPNPNPQLPAMLSMINDINKQGATTKPDEDKNKEEVQVQGQGLFNANNNTNVKPKDFNEIYGMIEDFKKQISIINHQTQIHKMFIINVMKTVGQLIDQATNQQMANDYQMANAARNNQGNQFLNMLSTQSPNPNQDFTHIFNDMGQLQGQGRDMNVNENKQTGNQPINYPINQGQGQAQNQMKDNYKMLMMNSINTMGSQLQSQSQSQLQSQSQQPNMNMNLMNSFMPFPPNMQGMMSNPATMDMMKKTNELNANRQQQGQQQQPPLPYSLGGQGMGGNMMNYPFQPTTAPAPSNKNNSNLQQQQQQQSMGGLSSFQNYPPNMTNMPNMGLNKPQAQGQGQSLNQNQNQNQGIMHNLPQGIPMNSMFFLNQMQMGERNNNIPPSLPNDQVLQMFFNANAELKAKEQEENQRKKDN